MRRCVIVILLLMLGACAAPVGHDARPARLSLPETAGAPTEAGQEFVLRALGFVGVPYRWGGTTPEAGFDCSGLIRYIYEQMTGRPLPYNAYGLARIAQAIDDSELQPGDLVFFHTLSEPFSHVGIYLGESRFLHAPRSGSTVRISDMNNRYWTSRYNGARRLPI